MAMTMNSNSKTIDIQCSGADELELDSIEEFQGKLKKRGKSEINQIIKSIDRYGFSFPFFVWQFEGHNYCLDGHGRIEALAEMRRRGTSLPLFPVAYIHATSTEEAKNKLLRLNSQYGSMTIESVLEFTDGMTIEWNELALNNGMMLDMSDDQNIDEELYSRKILAPIYEPLNEKPEISTLTDEVKARNLSSEISKADIPESEKKFLIQAATRHVVFDYGKIADYYSHSGPVVQDLMERSALVIIDFNKAIENGFVQISKELAEQYDKDIENE